MRTGNVLQDESKEEKTMEHIEMVEKLMEKANVSYAEAKQALENNNWDCWMHWLSWSVRARFTAGRAQHAARRSLKRRTKAHGRKAQVQTKAITVDGMNFGMAFAG